MALSKTFTCLQYSGLKESLPTNVQILTLEPWREDSLLLRLEHIMEQNEDSVLSGPVEVAYEVRIWTVQLGYLPFLKIMLLHLATQ